MNATNYYVSTTRLVLQADPDSPPSWQDLYTALPTLRWKGLLLPSPRWKGLFSEGIDGLVNEVCPLISIFVTV